MKPGNLKLLFCAALALFPAAAAADVSYFIYGRAFSVHTPEGHVVATTTSAIPGVVPAEPAPSGPPAAPVAYPGVTIEAYRADTNVLLGRGRANREGFYNLTYNAPEADHLVRFLAFLDFADGGRELVGTVDKLPGDAPIVVDDRLFSFNLMVPTASSIHGGSAVFSPSGQFLFTEVGDVDMDDIYDQQQDPGDAPRWGLTKGPELAFGGGLELYGLVGAASPARYYRLHYTGPVTGDVADPLYKKNYVITGTGIEIHRTLMGPKDVVISPALTLHGVYELDERLAGQPIPGHPGRVYSTFWTEIGLRAGWNSASVPDGSYVLSFDAFDAAGAAVPASPNNFATLNLHVVNTPPVAKIHDIQYLNGDVVLNDAAPCQTIILNHLTSPTFDDNLQFRITANHPDPDFFGAYELHAWSGHDSDAGTISQSSTPVNDDVVATPPAVTYQSCAYRFHLRVTPKITDGYSIIYIRDDNWYAAIDVRH